MFSHEVFKKSGDYAAIHRADCGHLRKHGGKPKDPTKYEYNAFTSVANAHIYAQSTGLNIKICRCV
jgi:hypothetical protein